MKNNKDIKQQNDIKEQIYIRVHYRAWNQIEDQFDGQIRTQVYTKIEHHIKNQVGAQVRGLIFEQMINEK